MSKSKKGAVEQKLYLGRPTNNGMFCGFGDIFSGHSFVIHVSWACWPSHGCWIHEWHLSIQHHDKNTIQLDHSNPTPLFPRLGLQSPLVLLVCQMYVSTFPSFFAPIVLSFLDSTSPISIVSYTLQRVLHPTLTHFDLNTPRQPTQYSKIP